MRHNRNKKDNIFGGKRVKIFFTMRKKEWLFIFLFAVAVITLTCLLLPYKDFVAYTYAKQRKLPVYSVRTEEKKIAVSFDCAWGVDYTDKLLDVMEKENVKCTFFMVEFWVKKYPEYVKKIDERGHEIGTHSATHPHMNGLSVDEIEKELLTSKNAIREITGKDVILFRPPFGEYSNKVIESAERQNLIAIQWSVDSLDWKNISAKEIAERVLKRVKKGSIVLFHNQGLHTAEALPTIIKEFKRQGYEFVTIGDLIYKDGYYIDGTGEQIKSTK